jgi:hypothetical protein
MFDVWGRIVGVFVVLIVITFLVQWILPRGKSKQALRRQYLRRDVAPMLGFFGILILGLSLAEAVRQEVIPAWGWGVVLGVLVSFTLWVMSNYRNNQSLIERSLWYYIRRLGIPVIATIIGIYLAVRMFGSTIQVFVASVLGIALMTLAIFLFAKNVPSSQP